MLPYYLFELFRGLSSGHKHLLGMLSQTYTHARCKQEAINSLLQWLGVEIQRFQVEVADIGKRLDQFVAGCMPEVSRERVKELIAAGAVLTAGTAQKASYRLKGGEAIEIVGESRRPPIKAEAEDIEIEVVLDDPEFAVVNKPAGMSVHAGAGDLSHSRGTLVNAMLHRFMTLSSGSGDELRPGIVHRLDRETSGLVIIAKTDLAHRRLAEQFQQRTINKTYLALVHGAMQASSGTISYAIARDPVRRRRMRAVRESGVQGARHAVSHYRVLEKIESEFGVFSFLAVQIETGRTHQIRVHLSALRHPIVGDSMYGAAAELRSQSHSGEVLNLGRNFLHAAELEFDHPSTGDRIKVIAPLPGDLERLLSQLRKVHSR